MKNNTSLPRSKHKKKLRDLRIIRLEKQLKSNIAKRKKKINISDG